MQLSEGADHGLLCAHKHVLNALAQTLFDDLPRLVEQARTRHQLGGLVRMLLKEPQVGDKWGKRVRTGHGQGHLRRLLQGVGCQREVAAKQAAGELDDGSCGRFGGGVDRGRGGTCGHVPTRLRRVHAKHSKGTRHTHTQSKDKPRDTRTRANT